jgi:polysaccharide export outer membrane protein
MKTYFILSVIILTLLTACRPSKQTVTDYIYFEKNLDTLNTLIKKLEEPVIKINDILNINVSSASLNQEQTTVFNLLNNGGYLVDYDGTINMPIIGKTRAEGLTKNQLNDSLSNKLIPYVKNPVLNTRFTNFRVLLMGEVRSVGWSSFPNERATIVDAIGQAGGITDLGMRENILLIRDKPNGAREYHTLNLNDARIFASPYYQLQQNDIVYVLPNNTRLIQYERQNSPFFRDLPIYLALITSILAFGTLIIALFR